MNWRHKIRRSLRYGVLTALTIVMMSGCESEPVENDQFWRMFSFPEMLLSILQGEDVASVNNDIDSNTSETLESVFIEVEELGNEGEDSDPQEESDVSDVDTPEVATTGLTGFFYEQLSENEKLVYSQLYSGISQYKDEFYVECETSDDIQTSLEALLADHPEFFWSEGHASLYGSLDGGRVRVTPAYTVPVEQIPEIQMQIETAVNEYLSSMPEDATTYLKVRTAYQYVIERTDYVLGSSQNQNIQSVFLYGQSICAGYAKAFQYLLHRAGVECAYIRGSIPAVGEDHAWNLVNIDGTYTWVDPTWGDPMYGENQNDSAQLSIIYDYLCMTDEELNRTGHVADERYTYPACTDMQYDFYLLLGDYFTSYDADSIQNHLMATVNASESITYFKFANDADYATALNSIFGEDGLISEPLQQKMNLEGTSKVQYYYSTSDEMRTLKIFW